ncbi:hypothetical protein [Bradyrhizobium sp. 27S5]|uniref:hypothetical protein n=1 Tax=Bradyrhizobium sp. 27S5 TaxID=3139728 RepID=UPI0030D0C82B
MPTPADIIDVIATRLSFPRKTVAQQDRLLVINGERKISGRGRSATASPTDAAAILIAVAATPICGPAININNYQSYANLNAVHLAAGKLGSWRTIDSLGVLPDGHTLLEALSSIIDCLSKGTLLPNSNGIMPPRGELPYHINIGVDLHAPRSSATIMIERFAEDSVEPDLKETLHYYQTNEPKAAPGGQIDFAQMRSFGILTLWSLAKLFDVARTQSNSESETKQ